MSHDGLPVRAEVGARVATADRRASSDRLETARRLTALAAFMAALVVAIAACGSTAGSGAVAGATGTPIASTEASGSAEASVEPSASAAARLVIIFREANSSKVTGGGIVNDLGDGSSAVTLGLVAVGFTDPLTAVLDKGACADMAAASPAPSVEASAAASVEASAAASSAAASGAASGSPEASVAASTGPVTGPPFNLADVAAGSSNTIVGITPGDLLTAPYAIVVHKSAADPTVVACADVTATPQIGPAASSEASAPAESTSVESAAPSAS